MYPSSQKTRLTGGRNSPLALEGVQKNLKAGSSPNFDNLPECVDDDDNWGLNCAIGVECSDKRRRGSWFIPRVAPVAVCFCQYFVAVGSFSYRWRDTSGLEAELYNAKEHIADLESAETIIVLRHEVLSEDVKQHHAKNFSSWKETFAENADSLINNTKVAKADTVKMAIEKNLISARFEQHVWAPHARENANVKRNLTIANALAKIRELLESVHSIKCSNHFVKISKSTRKLQQLTGPNELKGLELQTMPRLVDEASRLREELSMLKWDKDRTTAENKVMLVLGTESS